MSFYRLPCLFVYLKIPELNILINGNYGQINNDMMQTVTENTKAVFDFESLPEPSFITG